MKKIFSAICFLTTSLNAFSTSIECVTLSQNDTLEVELNEAEGFVNCYSLSNLAQNTSVNFVAFSKDNVRNKVTLFELNEGSTSDYIAEYHSDIGAANAFNINTTDRTLAFQMLPTSHLDTDKNTSITYMEVDGVAQILIDIDDLPTSDSEVPVSTGGCRYTDGVRICYDEQ